MHLKPGRALRHTLVLTLALAAVTCTDPSGPDTTSPSGGHPTLYTSPTGLVTATAPGIFAGAGDIASCSKTGDSQTAALLDNLPAEAEIFAIGDNVYEDGTTAEYADCYAPTW